MGRDGHMDNVRIGRITRERNPVERSCPSYICQIWSSVAIVVPKANVCIVANQKVIVRLGDWIVVGQVESRDDKRVFSRLVCRAGANDISIRHEKLIGRGSGTCRSDCVNEPKRVKCFMSGGVGNSIREVRIKLRRTDCGGTGAVIVAFRMTSQKSTPLHLADCRAERLDHREQQFQISLVPFPRKCRQTSQSRQNCTRRSDQ